MAKFNYLQFLNDPNELLQAEDLHFGEFPTFSLYFDEYFIQHLLKIRVILSPAKQKQTKTTQQQIQNQHKKLMFPGFL